MKLKQIHAEVWLGGILIILAVEMELQVMAGQFPNASAAVWPKAVLIGIMILSALLVIHGLQMTKDADGNADLGGAVLKGPMASLVMIVAYAVCMSFTGYFVSTAIFLPLGMAALGQRNWKAILGVTVGLELFVWFLFVVQLQLRMP